jgi:hypothetical protein
MSSRRRFSLDPLMADLRIFLIISESSLNLRNKKGRGFVLHPDIFNVIVRPEGFELPAYGFDVRNLEFPNLLNLL